MADFNDVIDKARTRNVDSKFFELRELVNDELKSLIKSNHRDLLEKTLIITGRSTKCTVFTIDDYKSVCKSLTDDGFDVQVKTESRDPGDFEAGGKYYSFEFLL